MRKLLCAAGFAVSLAPGLALSQPSGAMTLGQAFEGDTRLACEAILCLAASSRPAECEPAIRRFFSISFRRFSDTLRGRLNFLNLCPVVGGSMPAMKSAIVNGAGRCDAASLNAALWVSDNEGGGQVSNAMPDYCQAYAGHQYVVLQLPRYVGEPGRGGFWVEARDFEAAERSYKQRVASD
jgi:hypothetical protein